MEESHASGCHSDEGSDPNCSRPRPQTKLLSIIKPRIDARQDPSRAGPRPWRVAIPFRYFADMTAPSVRVERLIWRDGTRSVGERSLAEETAIAITYNRITHAVMMATPDDLFDFALGFSLSEGIVPAYGEIEDFQVIEAEGGVELRMWIPAHHMAALEKRRRRLAGATGCGMCGLESLGEALRPVPNVPRGKIFDADAINRAAVSLADAQTLNHLTRAVHGAGFGFPARG